MSCPKCGFDKGEYERTLKPEFESSHQNLLIPLRFKARLKGVCIGMLVFPLLWFLPSSQKTPLWKQISFVSSDPILTGVFIFSAIIGAVFGFFLANSWKEERLWQKFIASRLKELRQL